MTGTNACSPSCAVSCSRARQAVPPSDSTTCDGAARLTWSVPHTTRVAGGRSGLDMSTRHWPEAPRDATSRSGGGTATVTVRVSGCGPVSRISRLVRLPGGTGIRTIRPPRTSAPAARRRAPTRPAGSGPGLPTGHPGRPGHPHGHGVRGRREGPHQAEDRRRVRTAQPTPRQHHQRQQPDAQHAPPEPEPRGRRPGPTGIRLSQARNTACGPWIHGTIFTSSPDNSRTGGQ